MNRSRFTPSRNIKSGKYSFIKRSGFVHLHLHSEYSLLDGACRIAEIPEAAKRAGHKAVAITDHGVLYGVVDFFKECKKAGVKPIIGCEVYVAQRSMHDKDHEIDLRSYHLVLLVKDEVGYKNLIYMVSKSFSEGFYSKPRVDLELLAEHHEGLIALSACLAGYIPRNIVSGDYDAARGYAEKLRDIFGDGNFYLELQDHGLSDQKSVIEGILRIHEETGIPLVATNDVHYLDRSHAEAHAVLKCIQTNSHLSDGRPEAFEKEEFYYKSTFEMYQRFKYCPQALKNTARIAEKCNFEFDFAQTHLPRYTPDNGADPTSFLRSLVERGLEECVNAGRIVYSDAHPEKEYRERMEHELSVIDSMGYTEYYLIVWDFVDHSRKSGIMVGPGRGSGAGSLCAYLIGIVEIDPIVYGLLFERFLNPERVSMPDFDIDFPDGERELAIDYVRSKYGNDKVAQIITFGTMAAKAVLKDVGRALEIPYSELDKISALIPAGKDAQLSAVKDSPVARKMCEEDDGIRKLLDIALRLEGMPRHSSVHAAGIVITDSPLYNSVPLAVNNGVVVTQFAMKNIEELGFLKFDFLAIRYLTAVEKCVRQILSANPGFSLSDIDLCDERTYKMISRGDTNGVFQLEKGGMKHFLTKLKPKNINDIIAAISFYRPGPMDSIPKYLKNRADPGQITFSTPLLEPILSETFGCIVFQEQVMQIFRSIAGYSLGKADIVRRAISKKKLAVLEAERNRFVSGANENGVDERTATALFDEIVKFAEYAYNKSHAAAYALLTYRTAYLKCNYPLEYYCALLSTVAFDTFKTNEYINDCRSRAIAISLPHINSSEVDLSVRDGKILLGLDMIRNLGNNTADSIVTERKNNGPYKSLEDFAARSKGTFSNRRQIEFLIKSGALDGFGANRRQLISIMDHITAACSTSFPGSVEGQFDMFASSDAVASVGLPEIPPLDEYPGQRLLAMEKEALGVCISRNMLADYSEHIKSILQRVPVARIVDNEIDDTLESDVVLCGVVSECVDKETKNGASMSFIKFEDESGECEMVVFPRQKKTLQNVLKTGNALAVRGKITVSTDERRRLILESAQILVENGSYRNTEASDRPDKHNITDKTVNNNKGKAKKLFVRMDMSDEKLRKRVFGLISIFDDGNDFALFFDTSKGQYDKDNVIKCSASTFLANQLSELVGTDNVVLSDR